MGVKNCSVFVLCGGRGSRLQARTQQVPKVLIPVNGQPMLKHILEQFRDQGFSKFIFGTGYLSEQVEKYVASEFPALNVCISNAGVEAGMLKRLVSAKEYFGGPDDPVIVAYGDTFIDIDYGDLLAVHARGGMPMTLVTGKIQNPFGIVSIDESDRITSFNEKPVFDYYIGCLVLTRRLVDSIDTGLLLSLLNEPDGVGLVKLFQRLSAEKRLYAYRHAGLQISFNTEPELQNAQEVFSNYRTIRERS